MDKFKRKLYFGASKYVNSEHIRTLFILVLTCVLVLPKCRMDTFSIDSLVDAELLGSVALFFICDAIAKAIAKAIQNSCEDSAKLERDYVKLAKRYALENEIGEKEKDNKGINYAKDVKLPVVPLWKKIDSGKQDIKIVIEDKPDKFYTLPGQVSAKSAVLMKAHGSSEIYNQICIRCEDIEVKKDCVKLSTGRTYYYDSLITNRACDYKFDGNRTIREIYEPGPYIRPLKLSKFSNHIGFNGFVITSDGKIPLVHRSKLVSIGKNGYGCSVEASLKTKYALQKDQLSDDGKLCDKGISHAVMMELKDELGLCGADVVREDVMSHIIAFYRDLVEGGKPQFLYYTKLKIDSDMLNKRFKDNIDKKSKGSARVKQDGRELVMFSLKELRSAEIHENKIVIGNGCYTMMPSSIASLVMFLEYYKE